MEIGQIVLSKCGRDKNRYFIVVGMDETKNYVFLADGDMRKIEKPKKKKIKHVTPLLLKDDEIRDKLLSGKKISNAELRKHIKKLTEQDIIN